MGEEKEERVKGGTEGKLLGKSVKNYDEQEKEGMRERKVLVKSPEKNIINGKRVTLQHTKK